VPPKPTAEQPALPWEPTDAMLDAMAALLVRLAQRDLDAEAAGQRAVVQGKEVGQ